MNGCATGAIAVAALAASPAFAAGTASGTVITNNVTVDYVVAGVNQADATATNNITVDRKVNLTVARLDGTATSVVPGAASQVLTYTVQNVSNDALDFALTFAQTATGSGAGISGTDGFNVVDPPAPLIYLDDGDNVYDGGDTAVTHLNALAADATARVYIVSSIPLGLANGLIAAVTLTATAREDNNGALVGTVLSAAGTNTAGEDTIFADGQGPTDALRDAAYSATDDYVVATAVISAVKTSSVISGDLGTGAHIPGAVIQYCIAVTNAAGGAAATGVTISDSVPAQMAYNPVYGVRVGGASCAAPGSPTGTYSAPVVSGTIGNMAAGTTQTVVFQATIN